MPVMRSLYTRLTQCSLTRRYARSVARRVKRAMGLPDAYGDLLRIVELLQPEAILDIGSYGGDTVVQFLDETTVPIHAFEPTPSSFRRLAQRFGRYPSFHLHECALSDRCGKRLLFCNQNPETNSLLDNDYGNEQGFPLDTVHVSEVEVEMTTLDAWVADNLATGNMVIKSDVQGAEGLLLDGGQQTFRERVLAFYTEAQVRPMYKGQVTLFELHRRLVEDFGFCLYDLYPCLHDKDHRAVQLDGLWVKEARAKSCIQLSRKGRKSKVIRAAA